MTFGTARLPCACRMGCLWLCLAAALSCADSQRCFAGNVAAFSQWQWRGFTGSSPAGTIASSTDASLDSYNSWRWGANPALPPSPPPAVDQSSLADPVLEDTSPSSLELVTTTEDESPLESQVLTSGCILRGYVYVDVNVNGKMDEADWGIAEAKVALTLQGDSAPSAYAYTAKDGSYRFESIAAGNYALNMLNPSGKPASRPSGQILTKDGSLDVARTNSVVAGNEMFMNIDLPDGYTGINFSFAELVYPDALISKRIFTGDEPGPKHTPPPVVVVPEPSTAALLAIACMFFGILARLYLNKSTQ